VAKKDIENSAKRAQGRFGNGISTTALSVQSPKDKSHF
jgi:hypothetical protein